MEMVGLEEVKGEAQGAEVIGMEDAIWLMEDRERHRSSWIEKCK
jgi:hypothetical protein